jgi:hypothetical protein
MLVHSHENQRGKMCTRDINYHHLCMGTHEYTHTNQTFTFQQHAVFHLFLHVLVEGLGLLADCSTGWRRTEKCISKLGAANVFGIISNQKRHRTYGRHDCSDGAGVGGGGGGGSSSRWRS